MLESSKNTIIPCTFVFLSVLTAIKIQAQTSLPSQPSDPNLNNQALPISTQNNRDYSAFTVIGRDPFAVTPQMLDNENFKLKQDIDFVPITGDLKLPKMRLKGVITGVDENDPLTALLEIDGLGVFVVREGDTVGLNGIGNGRDVILIESISRLSLVVRTGLYGGVSEQRFVIR